MNLIPIIARLEQELFLKRGTNLFRETLPADVNSGVMVASENVGARPDYEIPGIHEARFQIIVRDVERQKALDLADQIYSALYIEIRTDFGPYVVDYIRPRHLPLPYRRSDGDLVEVALNFDIRFIINDGSIVVNPILPPQFGDPIVDEGGHDW